MSLTILPNCEPIAGCRLIEPVGKGGYGEVWKAEVDGVVKAVKIVRRTPASADEFGLQKFEQELCAIQRMESIRHPHLLTIERFEIVDDALFIITELADGNLFDVHDRFRNSGETGIPREPLLRYLGEVADALDALSQQFQLQHLDIKPQNLFLVNDQIRVGDFGLITEIQSETQRAGALTPLYAAPEAFDGKLTRNCDQYSLAIVYEELLTGTRPFSNANVQQLIWQHLHAPPNLAPLPRTDRPAVARALAKKPENRFPSCAAFINALCDVAIGPTVRRTAARMEDLESGQFKRLPNVAQSIRRLEQRDVRPYRPDTPPTILRGRHEETETLAFAVRDTRTAPPEVSGDGVLIPALIIGIGHTGLMSLKLLKYAFSRRFGGMSSLPHVRLLYVDSDPESMELAWDGNSGAILGQDETILTRVERAGHYLKPRRNGRSLIEGWFKPHWLHRIPKNPLVNGDRALGRLAFGDYYAHLTQKIEATLVAISESNALDQANEHTGLGIRTNRPRVYVVAGLAGGTGGGMFIDMAYAVRNRLDFLGYRSSDVIGCFGLPELRGPNFIDRRVEVNSFAALTELSHFMRSETRHVCTFDDGDASIVDPRPPFTRTMLISNANGPQGFAQLLSRELTQRFGTVADAERAKCKSATNVNNIPSVSTFGIHVMSLPQRELIASAARRLCSEVVDRWTARDASQIGPAVQSWIADYWKDQPLNGHLIEDQLRQAACVVIGKPPENVFAEMAKPLSPKGWFGGKFDEKACRDFLARVDSLLGRPDDTARNFVSGRLNDAFLATSTGIVKNWESKLDQMVVTLIEQPGFRLVGAQEGCVQLRGLLDRLHAEHSSLAAEKSEKASRAYSRMRAMASTSGRHSASEFDELAREYPKLCYQMLVHRQGAAIYHALRSDLNEHLAEIEFCRERLHQLRENFRIGSEAPEMLSGYLLPRDCRSIEDAIEELVQRVTPADIEELDRQMQKMVQSQFTALVHVCLSTSNLLGRLEPAMLKLTDQFLAGRLGVSNMSQLFFERYRTDREAVSAMVDSFELAQPELFDVQNQSQQEFCIVDVPTQPERERMQSLIPQALQRISPVVTDGHDELGFYREMTDIRITSLPHFGSSSRDAYVKANDNPDLTPHCRADVTWLLAAAE